MDRRAFVAVSAAVIVAPVAARAQNRGIPKREVVEVLENPEKRDGMLMAAQAMRLNLALATSGPAAAAAGLRKADKNFYQLVNEINDNFKTVVEDIEKIYGDIITLSEDISDIAIEAENKLTEEGISETSELGHRLYYNFRIFLISAKSLDNFHPDAFASGFKNWFCGSYPFSTFPTCKKM
jgi:hypothetical protein